jgi:ribosomal protein S18 acetylase RimI-like enzyme
MKIRKATKKDINGITKLLIEEDKYENKLNREIKIQTKDKIKKDVKISLEDKSILFLIAIEKRYLVGMISISIDKRGNTKIGRIQDIIIKEEFRRKGIGRKLFKKAEEYFKKQKCKKIQSFIQIKNKNSQRFWKNMNFKFDKVDGYTITKILK